MGLLPVAIYVLCFLAAALCTWLLLRGYARSGTRLLFWSGLCFGFLSLNSAVVLVDMMLFRAADLQALRHTATLPAPPDKTRALIRAAPARWSRDRGQRRTYRLGGPARAAARGRRGAPR